METASGFVEDTEDHMIILCFQYCISMNVSSILIGIAKTHAKTTAISIHFTCKQSWAAFSLCLNATSGNHKLESAALDALKEPCVEDVHNWERRYWWEHAYFEIAKYVHVFKSMDILL